MDADEQCQHAFGSTLEFYGFDVDRAVDGAEGLRRIESLQPDVILMDIPMPVLDGVTAVGRLRRDQRTRHLPIVAVTKVSEDEIEGLLDAGFDEVVVKPVDPIRVVQIARKWSRVVRR
jgi:CheY-like chemotaxis protein